MRISCEPSNLEMKIKEAVQEKGGTITKKSISLKIPFVSSCIYKNRNLRIWTFYSLDCSCWVGMIMFKRHP